MTAAEIIRMEIAANEGILPFDQFMHLALYSPEVGYYMKNSMGIGKQGDFYTSPTLHPIFSQLVAKQLGECWQALGSPNPFCIWEWGAGTGALAYGVLDAMLKMLPCKIEYRITEKSPSLQKKQQTYLNKLTSHDRVDLKWEHGSNSCSDKTSFRGVILTNELFDALPASRFTVHEGRWMETGVRSLGDSFEEAILQEAPEQVRWMDAYLPVLEEGDRVDVSLGAVEVMGEMAGTLTEGYILTFDYGDLAPDVYENVQFRGNIRAYHNQTLSYDPYRLVGEQDLTADVNFSLLKDAAALAGAHTIGFSSQALFLERLGFLKEVERLQKLSFQNLQFDMELQTMLQLYVPTGLGQHVKVLASAKGNVPTSLQGFDG